MAMDLVSWAWTLSRGHTNGAEESLVRQGGRPDVEQAKQQGKTSGASDSVATSKVAERIAKPVLHRPLSEGERHRGGQLVHYTFGALLGAAYGAGARRVPVITSGRGIPFGLAVWVAAAELGLPLMKLALPPQKYTLGQHCFSAISHAAFGFAAEQTRRAIHNSNRDHRE